MVGSANFTGVLLAGGKSRRMGRDKALLTNAEGLPLWRCQLEKLQGLGLAQVVVSGPPRPVFPPALRCLADAYPGYGPLGGLATVLEAYPHRPALVLALDVPGVSMELLASLLAESTAEVGRVPRVGDHYEPLVAVYPPSVGSIARLALASGHLRLQDFVRALVNAGTVTIREVPRSGWPEFINWNRPEDLPPGQQPHPASPA